MSSAVVELLHVWTSGMFVVTVLAPDASGQQVIHFWWGSPYALTARPWQKMGRERLGKNLGRRHFRETSGEKCEAKCVVGAGSRSFGLLVCVCLGNKARVT